MPRRPRALIGLLFLALVAVLVPLAPTVAQQSSDAGPPVDYTAIEGLSQPTYDALVRDVIRVPMHDGVELYVEVVRPDAEGEFPVIMEASPYHGTLADREGRRILPEPRDAEGTSLGLTGYFAPRGYAVAMVDLRGTGRSQGCLDHLGPNDAKDLKRIVEWAANQPWSNGRVGMTGHSYVGSTPSVAAAQNPEGLETIVPSAGLASMYHHQFQDGVPYFLQWMGTMWSYSMLSTNRHLPPQVPATALGEYGDNFGQDMEYFGCGWTTSSLVSGEPQASGQYTWWHAERDHSDGATSARIPVFLVHGVNDNAARVAAMDWFTARNGGFPAETETVCNRNGRNCREVVTEPAVEDKLWLGQWDHGSGCCPTRRGIQWTYALHGWFDKHLMQSDVETGPAVEVFMGDGTFEEARAGARTEVLTADSWPGSPDMLRLFPNADGGLRDAAAGPSGRVSFTGDPLGFNSPKSTDGATFSTEPLAEDLVLAGVPDLQLSASVTTPRVHLIANLFDESPDGEWRRISQFALNPELRNGLATPKPVLPGQRYDMSLEGYAMGHHLQAGHKLVLRVTTSDPDKVPTFAVDPQVTVFTGSSATSVNVPVVTNPTLYPDTVPLTIEDEQPPAGPAQPGINEQVSTGAPGAGVREPGVTSTMLEFEVAEGFDNARMVVEATPGQSADLDLYLQGQQPDGSWSGDMASGASGSLTGETLSTDRLAPGRYRIEVHNWAGPPANQVDVAITFFNTAGEPG